MFHVEHLTALICPVDSRGPMFHVEHTGSAHGPASQPEAPGSRPSRPLRRAVVSPAGRHDEETGHPVE
jgi:hypothetical protein